MRILQQFTSNKNLALNIFGSFGVKGLAMLISVLTLPAYLHYLEDQQILGVWFALLSILNWVLTFDLGIGNGLRNYLIEAIANKSDTKVKTYISSAYFSIGAISLALAIIGHNIIGLYNWNTILNISEEHITNKALINVVQIVYSGILLQFVLRLIVSILYAIQKTALSNFLALISNVIILVFLFTYSNEGLQSRLQLLAYVYILAFNLPLLIATIAVFATRFKKAVPSIFHVNFSDLKKILKLGSMFMGIQLALLIINATNQILITKLYEPEDVVSYQVYFKIFSIFYIMFSLITIPVWSAVTKAYNENRGSWIVKAYKYLNMTALGVSLFGVFIVIVFQKIVNVWLGDQTFTISLYTAFLFAIYYSIMIFINSAACIANGISKLKPQFYTNIVAAIIKIPLSIVLASIYDNWNVIIMVNIIIMIPALLIQHIAINKELRAMC